MCMRCSFRIKPHSPCAPTTVHVPCGECPECRSVLHNSWYFRLRAELEALVKKDWWVGFCTLTYSENRLPHLPFELVKPEKKDKYNPLDMPMCFDKNHIRKLINSLRTWMWDNYHIKESRNQRVKGFRWLAACEYGESTHRCHYHAIFCVPPEVPPEAFYDKLRSLWTSKLPVDDGRGLGFIIPKEFAGGFDSKGRYHKPFLVDTSNLSKAAYYAAKYCCKDIAFAESFNKDDFLKEKYGLKLRDYLCFHLQTRSLGVNFLDGLDTKTKLEYMTSGFRFNGECELRSLPLYFRNKLLFNNRYEVDEFGERKVYRDPTKFFIDNYKAIYEDKVSKLTEFVKVWRNSSYIRSLPCVSESIDLDLFSRLEDFFKCYDDKALSEMFLSYAGVDFGWVDFKIPRFNQWFLRYCDIDFFVDYKPFYLSVNSSLENAYIERVDYLFNLNLYYSMMIEIMNDATLDDMRLKMAESRNVARIKDKLNNGGFYAVSGEAVF